MLGGAVFSGIGLADATLIARMNESNVQSLMRATIRSSDGQPATFHVGDKYPSRRGYFGDTGSGGTVPAAAGF